MIRIHNGFRNTIVESPALMTIFFRYGCTRKAKKCIKTGTWSSSVGMRVKSGQKSSGLDRVDAACRNIQDRKMAAWKSNVLEFTKAVNSYAVP